MGCRLWGRTELDTTEAMPWGGGRAGGARREVRSPRDRRRHRCAPSPRGLGGWRPGHRTQLHTALHPEMQASWGQRGEGCPAHLAASWDCFQAQVKPRLEVVLTTLPRGGSSGVRGFLSSLQGATALLPAPLAPGQPRPLPVQKPILERKGVLEGALPSKEQTALHKCFVFCN